ILATDKGDSERRRRGYVSVLAHELAHMWFGDLVTMAWWDDTWLNESFASWASTMVLLHLHPDWDNELDRAASTGVVIGQDLLTTARPIRQPIHNEDDIEESFDSITYEKGEAVLAMFEAWIGADAFQAGIRRYLADHTDGSAIGADLFAALGAASGKDVA